MQAAGATGGGTVIPTGCGMIGWTKMQQHQQSSWCFIIFDWFAPSGKERNPDFVKQTKTNNNKKTENLSPSLFVLCDGTQKKLCSYIDNKELQKSFPCSNF